MGLLTLLNYKIYLVFLLVIFSQKVLAKTEKIDVIETNLSVIDGKDKLNALVKLTEHYFNDNPLKAKKYGEEALLLLKTSPNTTLQLSVGHHLFDAYRKLSLLDIAMELANENFELAENSGDLKERATTHLDLSNILSNKDNNYKEAISHLNLACKIYREVNDLLQLGGCINNIGHAYYYDTNYELALSFYIEALAVENFRFDITATHTLGNIALINMQYGRWDQALTYYHQALKHAETFNKNSMISEQLINIGVAYSFNSEFDNAIEYLNKASVLEKDTGNISSHFKISKRLGEDLSNIFERLFRVERSRNKKTGGSRLVLAICKSLIEAHNGEIYAESSSLGGLKIITKLPIYSFNDPSKCSNEQFALVTKI
jgi:tetratricopeptide (TPR) repeat protein